jgi:hypothetical protein
MDLGDDLIDQPRKSIRVDPCGCVDEEGFAVRRQFAARLRFPAAGRAADVRE